MKAKRLVLAVVVLMTVSLYPGVSVAADPCSSPGLEGKLDVWFSGGIFRWTFDSVQTCGGGYTSHFHGTGTSTSGPCIDPVVTDLKMDLLSWTEGPPSDPWITPKYPYTWHSPGVGQRIDGAGDAVGVPGVIPIEWSADFGPHSPEPTIPPYPYQPYGPGAIFTRMGGNCRGPRSMEANVVMEDYFYPGPVL